MAPFDNNWRLSLTNDKYQVALPDAIVYEFSTNGVLEKISDGWQNAVFLTYSNGLLARVDHTNGQYLVFAYDASNRLAGVNAPVTNLFMTFAYNGQGQLTNATRTASGQIMSTIYAWDSTWLTQRVNANGDVFAYSYTTGGKCTNLVVATNYYQHSVDYNSSTSSILTYARNGTNQVYTYRFDSDTMRIAEIAGPANTAGGTGKRASLSYNNWGDVISELVEEAATGTWCRTESGYDSAHNVTNTGFGYCAAPSNFWSTAWDSDLNLPTAISDPDGGRLGIDYTNGSVSRLKLYYDEDNSWDTTFGYTTNGLLTAVTNANGCWVRYFCGNNGFATSVVAAVGPAISIQHSQLGFVTNITLPGDNGPRVTSIDVNELGWVNRITYPDSLYETSIRDALGNVTNSVDTAGRQTIFTYAPTRKLTSVRRPLSSGITLTNSVTYDQQFNTVNIRDAKNRPVESYLLDIEDRPIGVTNLEGQTMSLTWGVGQFLKQVTRFDGTVVSNSWNSDGLLAAVAYPDSTNQFTYLRNGLPRTLANEQGMVSNSWNMAKRLTETQVSGFSPQPSVVSYSYFPAGQVSNVVSVAGTNTYDLDAGDRLSALTHFSASPAPLRFNYSYNTNNGLVSSMTCTNTGITASYGFNVMDQLTNLVWTGPTGNVLRSFAYGYSNARMITNIALENGVSLRYSYNELDQLVSEATGSVSSVYSYDEVGNRTQKTLDGVTVTYQYSNGCNRLTGWTAASVDNFSALRSLDVAGHSSEPIGTNPVLGQLSVTNPGGIGVSPVVTGTNFAASGFTVGFGTQQVVAAISDAAGNVGYATNTVVMQIVTNGSYGFNAAGCVTSITYSGPGFSENIGLTWNSQYQLTDVHTNDTLAEHNAYDALGRRFLCSSRTQGGSMETNYFIYDGVHCIADLNVTGGLIRTYTYGPGIDNLLAMTVHTGVTAKTYFPLTDHLGTVHALADESGSIIESYSFDAWGRVLSVNGPNNEQLTTSALGNRILWQGREYCWKTGLYYFRARWYDPITGRWLSNDPIGISGGLNQYCFCGDNPVNSRDPLGLCGDDDGPITTLSPIACGSGPTVLQHPPSVFNLPLSSWNPYVSPIANWNMTQPTIMFPPSTVSNIINASPSSSVSLYPWKTNLIPLGLSPSGGLQPHLAGETTNSSYSMQPNVSGNGIPYWIFTKPGVHTAPAYTNWPLATH